MLRDAHDRCLHCGHEKIIHLEGHDECYIVRCGCLAYMEYIVELKVQTLAEDPGPQLFDIAV